MAKRGGLKISLERANELLDDPYNCVERVQNQRRLSIPLQSEGKVYKVVHKQLDRETGKYSDRLGGFILAYENLKLAKHCAKITDDMRFITVDASADFILFRPNIGSTLNGVVTKIGNHFISCLVLGCFNVSVTEENDLCYQVQIGSSVALEVVSIQYARHMVQIKGKIMHVMDDVMQVENEIEGEIPEETLETENLGNGTIIKEDKSAFSSSTDAEVKSEEDTEKETSDDEMPPKKKLKLSVNGIDKDTSTPTDTSNENESTTSGKEKRKDKKKHKHKKSKDKEESKIDKKLKKKSKKDKKSKDKSKSKKEKNSKDEKKSKKLKKKSKEEKISKKLLKTVKKEKSLT